MKHAPVKVELPDGGSFVLHYLTAKELDRLLKVPTSVEQAELIAERHMSLARNIDKVIDTSSGYRSFIGCPHCRDAGNGVLDCETCSWSRLAPMDGSGKIICCRQTFSNIKALQAQIFYGKTSEGSSSCPNPFFQGESPEIIRDTTLAFILAHVEWAKAVIKNGGVK